MNIKNRGTGAGGAQTNKNGISFENTNIILSKLKQADFVVEPSKTSDKLYTIKSDNKLLGYYGTQNVFYNALEIIFGKQNFSKTYINQIFSKRIRPDAFLINLNLRIVYIFEKKWQQGSGSVDEKIQTGPYKHLMYTKLLRNFGYIVRYEYLLSDWFQKPEYRNVKEYYENSESIKVWVNGESLDNLDINDYIKP